MFISTNIVDEISCVCFRLDKLRSGDSSKNLRDLYLVRKNTVILSIKRKSKYVVVHIKLNNLIKKKQEIILTSLKFKVSFNYHPQ